jgi:hypothetical protein
MVGSIRGYGLIWGELSLNRASRGELPNYEIIPEGALGFAPDMVANTRHFGPSAFAFSHDKSLRCGFDRHGVWFSADLPETASGYGLLDSLGAGKALAVSIELDGGMQWRWDDASRTATITHGVVTGISIMRPGAAVFPGTRCWLEGDVPHDPQARALCEIFQERQRRRKAGPIVLPPIPEAFARAMGMWLI